MSTSSSIVKPSAEVEALQDHVFRVAIDLRGTITGEHGIGLAKRRAAMGKRASSAWHSSIGSKRSWTPSCSSTLVKCWDHERSRSRTP